MNFEPRARECHRRWRSARLTGSVLLAAVAVLLGSSSLAQSTPAPVAQPETAAEATARQARQQQAMKQFAAARKAWNARVAPGYHYAFGQDRPYAPGNIQVVGTGFLQPDAFPSAEYCGGCHQQAYEQWRESLHANAFRSPFYRRSVNLLIHDKSRGIAYARHCDSCHNPVAVLAGGLTEDSQVNRAGIDGDGVTCMTCHSVVKVGAPEGNGQLTMGVPSVMVDEHGNRIPELVSYDQILRYPKRHAQAVMHDFMHTAEFCAACHKANLPDELNHYKFVRAFTTYDEWQLSKYSHRNPLTFYTADPATCQGCHMQRGAAGLHEPGAKQGQFASHRWLAGNTAVPFYYGYDKQLQKTIAFLRSGNYLHVDIFALRESEGSRLIAPLGRTAFTLKAGQTVEAWVVIQNKGIGHSLLPEVRDLYQAWVHFRVQDGTGQNVYESGAIRADGGLDPSAHIFNNRPVDAQGEFVDNHTVWKIHSVAYDNTIESGRSVLVRYRFQVPEHVQGNLTLTAGVEYRHLRQSYLNSIFGPDHPAYPVVTLASQTRLLQVGRNHPSPQQQAGQPTWMRWNNAGIALLDQLQYGAAVNAFAHVVRLVPQQTDGYINVALTEIAWEKYASARVALRKALAMHPTDARALFYRAQLERRSGDRAGEIADLEEVVRQYPDSREARRELGIAYYQENELAKAMADFEALQQIDPDDLAAHYNLSILNRRAGNQAAAEAEQTQFIDEKIDPGAPTYALDYIRQHPEISLETIPWHVHASAPAAEANAPAMAAPTGQEQTMAHEETMPHEASMPDEKPMAHNATMPHEVPMQVDPCSWVGPATVSALLGGSFQTVRQNGSCLFTLQQGSTRRAMLLSAFAASPRDGMAGTCNGSPESLQGLGNAADFCRLRSGNGAEIVGNVRSQGFRVQVTTSNRHDPVLTPEALRMVTEEAAAQVAGNLF